MASIFSSPLFGITLCIGTYAIGVRINKIVKSPLCNPLMIAIALCILVLQLFHIPIASFNKGGDVIALIVAPATASLAMTIYTQFDILKKNLLPVLVGTTVGSLVSMTSVYFLCKAFHLDDKLTASLLPKSVTTPIAMEVAKQLGGIPSIAVAAVIVTGILGAVLSPFMIRVFKVDNPIASGLAIGTASHALGTAKALEIGELEGAMSGIAIGVAGIVTVVFSLFIT